MSTPQRAQSAHRLLKDGLSCLQRRDYEEAHGLFSTVVDTYPTQASAWLFRGIARAKMKRPKEALEDLQQALALSPQDNGIRLKAARTMIGLREPVMAIETLESTIASGNAPVEFYELGFQTGLKVGRYREAFDALRKAIALEPHNYNRQIDGARLFHNLRDYDLALTQLDAVIELGGANPDLFYLQSEVLRDMDRIDEALAAVDKALEFQGESVETLLRATEHQINLGAMGTAIQSTTRAVEISPDSIEANTLLGQLYSWMGDYQQAISCAERILTQDENNGAAYRIRGGCQVLLGELDKAQEDIEKALSLDEQDGEALLWLGEIARLRGDFDTAVLHIDMGIINSGGYAVPGHVSRLLTILESQKQDQGYLAKDAYQELLHLVAPTLPDPDTANTCEGRPKEIYQLMADAFSTFRGNRTPHATYVRNDDPDRQLHRLLVQPHSRFASRYTQELIRTRTEQEVLEVFEQKLKQYPDEPTVYCHIGELYLWLGQYEQALEAFLASIAITPKVRWAYIGLCASELMLGNYEKALDWGEEGIRVFPPPGRTLFVYRGEIYRRMGEHEKAKRDFEENDRITPGRMTGWMNTALLYADMGDESQMVPTFLRVRRRAPGLVHDALNEWNNDLDPYNPDAETTKGLFEYMLKMMRGNRSSDFITYFTKTGLLRFIPPPDTPDVVHNQ